MSINPAIPTTDEYLKKASDWAIELNVWTFHASHARVHFGTQACDH